jgi:Bifunctional DNA primase/polymerase, N-terminal
MEIDPPTPNNGWPDVSPDLPHDGAAHAHANGAVNGHSYIGTNTFGLYAPLLLRNGYSPAPIESGGKRPLAAIGDWNRLRATPLTEGEISAIAAAYPNAGLGVLGGYNGLVPIDIDTEDPDIQAVIYAVLPEYLVAKRGRRGATVFYRDRSGLIKPRKFKNADGSMILEVLTTGQVVLPPTIHPETHKPYCWLTEHTLLEVSIDELPELS